MIVESGQKQAFLRDLGWLSALAPFADAFQNTADGYKLLCADGVFGEFAIAEEAELAHIPFAPGRLAWKREGVSGALAEPRATTLPRADAAPPSTAWLLGEALTNLYVGLGRYRRGEKLSARRFVQGYAVDRVFELAERLKPATSAPRDLFNRERRLEQRHPPLAAALAPIMRYAHTPESARAILAWLAANFSINAEMQRAILALC